MFVFNIKVSGTKLFRIFFIIVASIILILFSIGVYRVFNKSNREFTISDSIKKDGIVNINSLNYTNILKTVHEDIDSYVGTKIHCTGYVYKLIDFSDTQFVLARDMVISSDYQSVIVGFLCEYKDISNYKDGTWIEITGELTRGEYHGDMPVIKITKLKETSKPNDEFVYPPDKNYIPTSGIL